MQFLKILFWFLLAFVAALFTYGNWTSIQINLWSGLIADVNLPLLLLVTFLLGLLPTYLYLGTVRWRLRQRLSACERLLAEQRAQVAPPALVVVPANADPLTPSEPAAMGRPA